MNRFSSLIAANDANILLYHKWRSDAGGRHEAESRGTKAEGRWPRAVGRRLEAGGQRTINLVTPTQPHDSNSPS